MIRLAAITKATVNNGVPEIYADTLEDLDPAALTKAFDQAERTCRFLPVPAELREMAGVGGQAEGLAAWEFLQKILNTHLQRSGAEGYVLCEGTGAIEWDADKQPHCKRIPLPAIPAEIERAVRLCGGWARLKDISDEELPWVKKEFLVAIASYDKTEMAYARLSAGSAMDMVKQLSGSVKGLSGVVEESRAPGRAEPPNDWKREEIEDTGENTNYGPIEAPEPITVIRKPRLAGEDMTDEEWEQRKKVLAEQAREVERKSKGVA